MPIAHTQTVEEAIIEAGPRLKKFTRAECRAIADSGVIGAQTLELVEGDILAKRDPFAQHRRRWVVEELEALRATGALNVERLELVDGELYDKVGKNRPRVITLHQIAIILNQVFGIGRVTQESVIEVARLDRSTSAPAPDIVVTENDFRSYPRPPRPEDVCLIVEVSDSTLRYDLRTKAALYARSGIVEYWVADDLNGRKLIVHREPSEGRYASVVSYGADASVVPLAAPGHTVLIGTLFLS